jgi:glycosyltransferase involved in cell wall biosynthesis
MKICFLASAASIHSHKWINFFSDLGYEIVWISLDPSTITISESIDYHEFESVSLFNIYKIRKLILGFNPDITHVHYLGNYALLGVFSGARCIVTTPWGSDVIEGKKSFIKKLIISRILHKSNLITCDAYHMREEVKEFGVSSKNINIINFGIDTERFSYKDIIDNELSSLGITEKLKVISLRDFEPVYDIENLIISIPLVLSEIPDVQFILLGRGTLKNNIKSLVKDMNLDNSVLFLDYIDNVKMPYIMSSADVLVSTSLSDAGIAGSTAEAMSCELPIVFTDSGENSRWVDHGKNGFLVTVSDPRELAQHIILLLKNKDLRHRMGEKARETILAHNDYATEMGKMHLLYKGLLK